MTVLRSLIAEFAVKVDDSPLQQLGQKINHVKGALVALGAALALDRVAEWVSDVAAVADELGDTAERLNISTSALQEWGHAADLSGSSAEEFQGSISHLVRSIAEAGSGGKEAGEAFRKLGVDVKDSSGALRSIDEILPELADGVAGLENPTERAAVGMQVLGRGAQGLIPLFARGAAGVEQLRQGFRDLGGGLSDETIEQASEYKDTLARLEVVGLSLKSSILGSVLPAFQVFAESMQRVAQGVRWVADNTKLIETSLGIAGAAVTAFSLQWIGANAAMLASAVRTWVPIIARFALAGAAVLGVVAIVEDLITLFDGGDSVIGDFVDSIFGLGTAEEVVVSIKQAFDELFYAAHRAAAAIGLADEPTVDPNDARERRRQNAVQSGDLKGYLAEKTTGRSREQAREDFLAQRQRFIQDRPEAATAEDVNVGLASRASGEVSAPRVSGAREVSAPRAAVNAKVDAPVVNVHLPPGAPAQQVENTRKVVAEELDKHHRRTLAAFGGVAP